MLLLLTAA